MVDQPHTDPQIVFEQLQLTPDLVGSRGAFPDFLLDRLEATHRFLKTRQRRADLLGRWTEECDS